MPRNNLLQLVSIMLAYNYNYMYTNNNGSIVGFCISFAGENVLILCYITINTYNLVSFDQL